MTTRKDSEILLPKENICASNLEKNAIMKQNK